MTSLVRASITFYVEYRQSDICSFRAMTLLLLQWVWNLPVFSIIAISFSNEKRGSTQVVNKVWECVYSFRYNTRTCQTEKQTSLYSTLNTSETIQDGQMHCYQRSLRESDIEVCHRQWLWVTSKGHVMYYKRFHCLFLKNTAYIMHEVNYNSRTSYICE